jgi:NAD(P)H-dependent FMN reductase
VKVAAISGSLRAGSSNAALLQAAKALAPAGMEIVIYDGLAGLPPFNPDLDVDEPPGVVRHLREILRSADAVLISSPEYAHGVPGVLKNALDWLVSDGLLVGKPVVLMNAAPVGGQYAQASLIETLQTMNWRVVKEASLIEPFVKRKLRDGEMVDGETAAALRAALMSLLRTVGT